ncbi:hypothetical protein [Stutzerimonas nitrititolerans]|uniref:hypothetical protein n=1 Tax=Stutzerimonas nitrititolerans TaxID=2482751 RepID=UPI0028993E7B|nr:hypothetical protein [Stutzerimonas nitrititolerans]
MTSKQTAQEIKRGMALAFFASAYADQADECGQPLRGEIMEQLPAAIDPAATHAADTLARDFIGAHAFGEKGLSETQQLAILYLKAARLPKDGADRELSPELFGHYLAMQAMGTGVGLESFGYAVHDGFTVPYCEFGSHSLQGDYFESQEATQ